MEKQKIWESAI